MKESAANLRNYINTSSFSSSKGHSNDGYYSNNNSIWNSCMENHVCKSFSIIGFVIIGLIIFWIVFTIVQCVCFGVKCVNALFCVLCCNCCRRR